MFDNNHKSVMLHELLKYVDIDPNGIYFDCTFGVGGHSFEFLKYLNKFGKLCVIDKDFSFLDYKFFFSNKIKYYRCSFDNIFDIVNKNDLFGKIDGIFVDLGISTNQLFDRNRGLGFSNDGFLDMRIDFDVKFRAVDWFNFASFDELLAVFYFTEDLKLAYKITKSILLARKIFSIKTVDDFYNTVFNTCSNYGIKPKSFNKIYQAIRIFINNDFHLLLKFLNDVDALLSPGGLLILITFNSIEDRIVKNFFSRKFFYKSFFCLIKPSIYDINTNFSSRSSIMRIFIK